MVDIHWPRNLNPENAAVISGVSIFNAKYYAILYCTRITHVHTYIYSIKHIYIYAYHVYSIYIYRISLKPNYTKSGLSTPNSELRRGTPPRAAQEDILGAVQEEERAFVRPHLSARGFGVPLKGTVRVPFRVLGLMVLGFGV